MHIDDEKVETTDVDEENFGEGFEAVDKQETDEFTDKPIDKPAEVKTEVKVVTDKPTETKVETKEPDTKVVVEPKAGDAADFLTDDENTQLAEAEKLSPGVAKIIQRTKSWAGRLKKAHTDLTEAQTLLAQREADDDSGVAAPPPGEEPAAEAPKVEAPPALSEEDQQTLDELATEYPVINKAIGIYAKQAALAVVNERLEPLETSLTARDRASSEVHFREVAGSHADFYEIATGGPLDDWIDSLPHLEAKKLLKIRDEGSTGQVIGLLDRFKTESGYQKPVSDEPAPTDEGNGKDKGKPKVTEATKAKRKAALADSEAVPRHSGGPPAAAPDDSDFNAGFDANAQRQDE